MCFGCLLCAFVIGMVRALLWLFRFVGFVLLLFVYLLCLSCFLCLFFLLWGVVFFLVLLLCFVCALSSI